MTLSGKVLAQAKEDPFNSLDRIQIMRQISEIIIRSIFFIEGICSWQNNCSKSKAL